MKCTPLVVVAVIGSLLAACQKTPEKNDVLAAPGTGPAPVVTQAAASTLPKSYDGPFGLAGSMPVAELVRLNFKPVDSDPSIFVGQAPKPMQEVDEYVALATPATGVCRIVARVKVPVVNGSGDQIRNKVDQLAEVMATKYGKHSVKTDFAGEDVYKRNPQYWMLGLKEDSVLYAYAWQAGKTAQPLPHEIKHIEISANASELDRGWASIQYTFANFDECLKENKKQKAVNL